MKLPILWLIAAVSFSASAQSDITTLIFVRHTEKVNDGSKDPELSQEGTQRANRLFEMLSNQSINAVYSTDFKRTRNTVSPLALGMKLMLNIYSSATAEQLRGIIQQYKGGTVVICGHSNTTPAMVNMLTGSETMKAFDDGDYGNILIVSVAATGETKVTRLTY